MLLYLFPIIGETLSVFIFIFVSSVEETKSVFIFIFVSSVSKWKMSPFTYTL